MIILLFFTKNFKYKSGKVKLMLKEVRELKIKINKVNKIFILCEKLQFCLLKAWIRIRAHFRDPAFIRKCTMYLHLPKNPYNNPP